MTIEEKLQTLKGKRILWRDKVQMVKSVRKINKIYLIITDVKTMNLAQETVENLLNTAIILD